MRYKRVLVWIRNDLRLRDHEALYRACEEAEEVYPVYCLDPRQFEEQALGFAKTGSYRVRFLLESLQALRESLRERDSELLVRMEAPETAIPQLASQLQAEAVYASREVTAEELAVEQALEQQLWKQQIPLYQYWQSTLYHVDDIPWPIQNLPEVFTQFRKENERSTQVRESFPLAAIPPLPLGIESGVIPGLAGLGLEVPAEEQRAALFFKGGEVEALRRVDHYFWQTDLLSTYKETRNGLVGADYSSKFSAWLALGCLSPRYLYEEVKRYEAERIQNKSTYWLIFELIWRDYFRFVAKRYGNSLFHTSGIRRKSIGYREDEQAFEAWRTGQTGTPFIDSSMRELLLTGFMSNRGRQIVASYLCKDLKLNWTWGAAWFESQLIDYDVCSNWGNWNYVAGVGNDPREDRYFNIMSQANRYDPKGEHVRLWVPELGQIADKRIHHPQSLTPQELRALGIEMGVDYPHPLIDFERWLR